MAAKTSRPSTEQLLTRAKQALKSADWAAAAQAYCDVLDRFPANKKAQQGLHALRSEGLPALLTEAQAAQTAQDWARSEVLLSLAARIAPDVPEVGLALVACQLDMGRIPAALRSVETVLEQAPNHLSALTAKGRALRELNRPEATVVLEQALVGAPEEPEILSNLGMLSRATGDRDGATTYFRRGAAAASQKPFAHLNLAQQLSYTKDEPHLNDMLNAVSRIPEAEAGPLHFALFKAFDDLRQTETAFGHLLKGNRLTKAEIGYDFQGDAINFGLAKTLLERQMEPLDEVGTLTPIFVTGLPRSGTTLTERILSRAQGAQACGELTVVANAMSRLLSRVVEREGQSLGPTSMTRDDLYGLRRDVLEGVSEYSDGSPVLIDKMPLNFRWIGFLCAALPEARFVHMNRDPVAVAWSLFQHRFAGRGNGFAYDITDMARFMVLHRELMAHWREMYPNRIYDLDYGTLVAEPETQTRALADALGLEWTPDWLNPQNSSAPIQTASAQQARRPIYAGSDSAWKRYDIQFAPMVEALRSAGVI